MTANTFLGNRLNGVFVSGSVVNGSANPVNNEIGYNDIATNQADGIAINLATGTTVEENYIGTSPMGGIGNTLDGVNIAYSPSTSIGNGNTISGNGQNGIRLTATVGAIVGDSIQGNLIAGERDRRDQPDRGGRPSRSSTTRSWGARWTGSD